MDHYQEVNAAWPTVVPSITRDEARRASRKLARHFGGRPRREPRRCWISARPNCSNGWWRLVHDVAHETFSRSFPHFTDHNPGHAKLERDMIEYVVAKGWLNGILK